MCDINKKNTNKIKLIKTDPKNFVALKDINNVEECMSKYTLVKNAKSGKPSLKDTEAYKKLSPFGTYKTESGKYNYGNKSYLKKKDLCLVLMYPETYFQQNIKECKKDKKYHKNRPANKKNRVRKTRKGKCPTHRQVNPVTKNCDTNPEYIHKGLTTTGKDCCYVKKMSKRTLNKRKKSE